MSTRITTANEIQKGDRLLDPAKWRHYLVKSVDREWRHGRVHNVTVVTSQGTHEFLPSETVSVQS